MPPPAPGAAAAAVTTASTVQARAIARVPAVPTPVAVGAMPAPLQHARPPGIAAIPSPPAPPPTLAPVGGRIANLPNAAAQRPIASVAPRAVVTPMLVTAAGTCAPAAARILRGPAAIIGAPARMEVEVAVVAINAPAAEMIAPLPPAHAAARREIASGPVVAVETTAQTRAARKAVTVMARNVRPSRAAIAPPKAKDALVPPMASVRKRNANPFRNAIADVVRADA